MSQGLRYDPAERKLAQRHGKEKGVRVFIAAAELRKAGIDPDGPVPEYKVWGQPGGGVHLRLYQR